MRGFVGSFQPERPSAAVKVSPPSGGAQLHKPERSAGAEASGLERRARSGSIPTMKPAAPCGDGNEWKAPSRNGNARQGRCLAV